MKDIDWSKAPKNATHHLSYREDGTDPFFGYDSGDRIMDCAENGEYVRKTDISNWNVIERPTESWSGEGLPPVGILCEYQIGEGPWFTCTVTHILRLSSEKEWQIIADCPHLGGEQLLDSVECSLRPIRTQAQIEAEERDAAIKAMLALISHDYGHHWEYIRDTVEQLYDAGLRMPGESK